MVQIDVVEPEDRGRLHHEIAVGLEGFGLVEGDSRNHVIVAVPEAQDARVALRHVFELDTFEVGQWLPVGSHVPIMRIGLEDDGRAPLIALDHEGPGANRRGSKLLRARFIGLLVHDARGIGGQGGQQRCVGLAQFDLHVLVVNHRNVLHRLQHEGEILRRIAQGFQREDHVIDSDRLAIAEFRVAYLECVSQAIGGDFPGFR